MEQFPIRIRCVSCGRKSIMTMKFKFVCTFYSPASHKTVYIHFYLHFDFNKLSNKKILKSTSERKQQSMRMMMATMTVTKNAYVFVEKSSSFYQMFVKSPPLASTHSSSILTHENTENE